MASIGKRARQAARVLATTGRAPKDRALQEAASALRRDMAFLLQENARDMEAGREKGLSAAMLDRLELTPARIEAMAKGLEEIAALPDPVGRVMAAWDRPNGLKLERVSTPLGVVGVIYESRPNVTADAGALCLKAGNAVILRGGSESFYSSRAICARLMEGLQTAGLPADAIQMVPTTDREAVGIMLSMSEDIDVIVPRGGRSLIERITADSRIPLFKHLEGVCHTYVHADADPDKARSVILNAKMRRTGVCGATETILIDRSVAERLLPSIIHDLRAAGCEVRGDELVEVIDPDVVPATEEDWSTEYLDAIVAVRVVEGLDEAIGHIARHSSSHTEAIITESAEAAERFLNEVDSAIVMHNASTQFADGGEFGMGAEIGISTGRLHARGPVGVEQLTIFKYKVRGNGQVRP
ncbi:glutamate-5-semialdehyde dehydrogenase [Phaeovibrio sulfidiphilus]|uniref:Gamma-glutamyl phosphate reductase n=2 Tax=Phaeovibrio sulfidiphilus TaxID=1220600 RepID=A0A8J6YZ35_9PROT|nr:glutamate-5-semialdehyde dehydrogenase [Phaeovibrio sulfidiphilus]MBE1237193.1 glutamate-5-semialdehyde dehydrogenase [Phaeovibrio sulfidiphilus]